MCASAIRWTEFKEYIYGTSIDKLVQNGKVHFVMFRITVPDTACTGWGQIRISSQEVFRESLDLPGRTTFIADILTNETDPYFMWQYDQSYPCPKGCSRCAESGSCTAS